MRRSQNLVAVTYDFEATWGQYDDTNVYASYRSNMNRQVLPQCSSPPSPPASKPLIVQPQTIYDAPERLLEIGLDLDGHPDRPELS